MLSCGCNDLLWGGGKLFCVDVFVCVRVKKAIHMAYHPHSAVGNVSGYRCVSDCNSRGREFYHSPVPHFLGD